MANLLKLSKKQYHLKNIIATEIHDVDNTAVMLITPPIHCIRGTIEAQGAIVPAT